MSSRLGNLKNTSWSGSRAKNISKRVKSYIWSGKGWWAQFINLFEDLYFKIIIYIDISRPVQHLPQEFWNGELFWHSAPICEIRGRKKSFLCRTYQIFSTCTVENVGLKQAVYEGLLLYGGDSATSYRRRRNGVQLRAREGEKEGRRTWRCLRPRKHKVAWHRLPRITCSAALLFPLL